MERFLRFIGGVWVVSTIYKAGKIVGEIEGSMRQIRNIRKEFKTEKERIWETEARA